MIAWGESLVLGNRIYCNYTKTALTGELSPCLPCGTFDIQGILILLTICQICTISLLFVLLLSKNEIKTNGNVVIHCSKSPWCVGGYRTGTLLGVPEREER